MAKTALTMIILAASLITGPASAVTFVTTSGSADSFAAPAGTVIDFSSGSLPDGFTLTGSGYEIVTGNSANNYAEAAFSDGSPYLAVGTAGVATLQSSTGYTSASLFMGSIDNYNSVEVLSTTGAVIATYTGAAFTSGANGDQTAATTNQRVTFVAEAGELIGGLRFLSSVPAFELDNVVFAVPETSTWVMMFIGFSLVAPVMRFRRRNVPLVFA